MRMTLIVLVLVSAGCSTPLPPPVLYAPGPEQMVSEPMRDPIINPSAIRSAKDQQEREATFKRNATAHVY
mgnify:CR=1 FL=1